MSYIDIPEETLDVAWRAFCESEQEHDDYATALADALTAAAPLIVAAELLKLANEFHELRQALRDEDGRGIRSSGLGTAIYRMTERAAELEFDPPGGAT